MIRSLALLVLCLFLQLQIGIAQISSRTIRAIFKHLLDQPKTISVITVPFSDGEGLNVLPHTEMPRQLWQEFQYLVSTHGDLYLGINGTGQLYKMSNEDNTIIFIRDDSTFHIGDNFCAVNFSIGDTIYSFGGYGFWKNNGLLRFYDQNIHEWEVIKTNREIISTNCIVAGFFPYFWVDDRKRNLYLAGQKITNDGLNSSTNSSIQINNSLFNLDIAKGEWTEMGKLKFLPEARCVNSPWGPLFIGTFVTYINDFVHNQKLSAKKTSIEKFKKVFTGFSPDVAYFIDSTLYFGNYTYNTFDSVQLSKSDFEYRGEQVYTPQASQRDLTTNKYTRLLWLAAIPIVILLFAIFYKNRKRKIEQPSEQDESVPQGIQKFNGNNGNHSDGFSEIEKELIRFIYDKTSNKYIVSVEEINKVLGLSGKNESVQKKNRSECINDINKKWKVLHGSKTPLIDRQRSEFDKRSFEYFIQPVWLDRIAVLLKKT